MLANERVIPQVRVCLIHSIDLLSLARRKAFVRVEAPSSFEKPAAAESLVNAGYAPAELVRRIEECSVRIGDLLSKCQKGSRHFAAGGLRQT